MKLRQAFLTTALSAAVITGVVGAVQPFAVASPGIGGGPGKAAATQYLVLFKTTTADAAARQAITKAGGTITEENTKVGYAYVSSDRAGFSAALDASGAVAGAAKERVIGRDPALRRIAGSDLERMTTERKAAKGGAVTADAEAAATPLAEPLANLQWDMRQIGATPTGSYAKNQGSHKVKVGIIDTGIDGTHPDIAANFDATASRNFVTDLPDIDGPCEHASCVDPANEDDDGHGTHVASTIGAPINGIGIAGVAPKVSLVNIRAGQDSGYFFLKATLEALTYAGDIGVDVVNMSFYTDPWLFNCANNPADSLTERTEQRIIRTATQRALDYATHRGVLPVAAMGNEFTNLNHPTSDDTSPDYPADAAKTRAIDNSCISVPTESKGVVSVSSTGISTRMAYYSNYGTEQTDIAAPGGDVYDTATNGRDLTHAVLAAYPASLAQANGDLNEDGTPNNPAVVRDCKGDVCGYYQYLQGTSMASPHAAGVAALVVARHGKIDKAHGGVGLNVNASRSWLYKSAQPHACPTPRTFHYTRVTAAAGVVEAEATCTGPTSKNGFYGRGIVNAYAAATG
ncbi:MAG: peptidase and in kexin sedolisin [Friedmanniella sp.]|nr:peptidase and in kexin sedolisin [Friedmanniella sp.]